jgi:hypothetical protein
MHTGARGQISKAWGPLDSGPGGCASTRAHLLLRNQGPNLVHVGIVADRARALLYQCIYSTLMKSGEDDQMFTWQSLITIGHRYEESRVAVSSARQYRLEPKERRWGGRMYKVSHAQIRSIIVTMTFHSFSFQQRSVPRRLRLHLHPCLSWQIATLTLGLCHLWQIALRVDTSFLSVISSSFNNRENSVKTSSSLRSLLFLHSVCRAADRQKGAGAREHALRDIEPGPIFWDFGFVSKVR